jgi:DNA invertase Pin-like site-specific DNA recombinase
MTQETERAKRAVVYLRVASRHPQDAQAVAYQREACQRIAAKYGLVIVREYVDLGRPAQPAKQTALQQLFTDLAEYRDVAHVVVWDYARLARDLVQLNAVISELRARSAEVVTMTGVEVAERFIRERIAQPVVGEAPADAARTHRPSGPKVRGTHD